MDTPGTQLTSPPEPGDLVEVRSRRWIVADVKRAAAPTAREPEHLLTLASVEDDGMGEELRVLWEIEPGAQTIPGYGLPEPDGFDDPKRLDAFLLAVRWGAVSSADLKALQSPFRSGIEIEDYQLDPVVRAIQMPRANLLIADDVGLGKTIETGLVIQEFITRHRARRVLVVCPSSLQLQWRDQMRDKFGLEFRIVDSDLVKDLRRRRGLHVNPWTHFPRLITSIDFLKRERPLRLMREVLPAEGAPAWPRRFDILVVDEAHNVAPSGRGRYAVESQRTQAIRTLTRHFEHRLFVSATPHNGYLESFTALLELLDSQRFAVGVEPDPKQLAAVMVRRLKTELPPDWQGRRRFPARDLDSPIRVAYTEEERGVHRALAEYARSRRAGARSDGEAFAAEFVLKLLKKRLFSSPAAFLHTLDVHTQTLRRGRRQAQRAVPLGVLKARAQAAEESDDDREARDADQEFFEATEGLFADLSAAEKDLLARMRAWAERHKDLPDSKARELLAWLERHVRPRGTWNDTRVIIFTEYLDTLGWLHQLLATEGYAQDGRLLTLTGGLQPEKREAVKAAFQANPTDSAVRILLATDAASEGIDLQNHCSRLIHYEIPWNPNRMEQRNGRVDRYGQRADKVDIFHFVDASFRENAPVGDAQPGDLAGDLEFLFRAAQKLQRMERDLLGKVAPVLASQVEDAMLGRRTRLDLEAIERGAEPVRRMLRFERDLKRQIERLRAQIDEAQDELDIRPANVEAVVSVALDLAGQPALVPDQPGTFRMPPLRGSWSPCLEGLEHPHTHAVRPMTFDASVARGRDDVVLVHLNHRLVQMSMRLLRAEIWRQGAARKLHRVAARILDGPNPGGPLVIALARLVIVGGDGRRLHEEILAAGGLLKEGSFRRLGVGEIEKALADATHDTVGQRMRESLTEAWPRHRDALRAALEARKQERAESRRKQLVERRDKESADITAVLRELQRSISAELADEGPEQLELWPQDEREQRERDRDSLRVRLAQIPGEIELEQAAVARRYADPEPQLFPCAVLFLVPRALARIGE